MAKKQALTGDFVVIKLKDDAYCFARVLREPYLAFYDACSRETLKIEELVSRKVILKLAVMNRAVTSGRWQVIGHLPLEEELQVPIKTFKQDAISQKLYVYVDGQERPATRDECEGLERTAVWDPEHVEDRLRDHFAGVPNKWAESLKLKA
ncbi:immunity 26/phosphotriesterase HocA family protein [Ensifer sp. Root31]|uniref:immunity 26/phosphotriesterase HocA family protein n=1 Tax=Ensifer sp. Root31 TaxID=1736512 RepID=UPI0009E9EF87|nr:immunity 26/phosphotriesterase HocA family protein [Ensifer sp. Root31]